MKRTAALFLAVAAIGYGWWRWHATTIDCDVLVVGAGIGGLSAAYESGLGGLQVVVAEMNSVFGGNGVLSEGGLWIAGTPLQHELGLRDSPELAERDILEWGEDADAGWARVLATESRREIYDWLHGLGVRFFAVRPQAGNHVPRFHENTQKGLGILRVIYRECSRNSNIRFLWNTRIDGLDMAGGAVTGAHGTNLRSGRSLKIRSRHVVLATGGFQGNERLVREHWREGWPQPERLLLGASPNSAGSGLKMGVEAGAATHRLDHQWHYPFGVPDPRFPGENRAVSVRNLNAIWLNALGERFVNEWKGSRFTVEAVVRQQPAFYWLVFDESGVADLRYAGTDWSDAARARALLLDNPNITRKADSLVELARLTGMPADRLTESIARYNRMVRDGEDSDFQRFGRQALPPWLQVFPVPTPRELLQPPFYAMQAFPMTRKNMGGLQIDLNCRVLNGRGEPVPGLLAVGEVAGLGGVNGKAGLEGTFLGPSLIQGRRAGRHLASGRSVPLAASSDSPAPKPGGEADGLCRACHTLPMRFFAARRGYRHFARSHAMAEERNLPCGRCHAEIETAVPWRHRMASASLTATCDHCHLPWAGPPPATR